MYVTQVFYIAKLMEWNNIENIVCYLPNDEKKTLKDTHMYTPTNIHCSNIDVSHPLLVVSQQSLLMSCLEHYNLRKGKKQFYVSRH